MFYTFAGIHWNDSHAMNAKLYNFIILWNMIKLPQNFVQSSFSMQLAKIWNKKRGEALASIPKHNIFSKHE